MTYSARALAERRTGTDSRLCDQAWRVGGSTICGAYDLHIDPHQVISGRATCNENAIANLPWFGLVQFSLV
jgi:hypothetical protein